MVKSYIISEQFIVEAYQLPNTNEILNTIRNVTAGHSTFVPVVKCTWSLSLISRLFPFLVEITLICMQHH